MKRLGPAPRIEAHAAAGIGVALFNEFEES
jgi:hypothetical protein